MHAGEGALLALGDFVPLFIDLAVDKPPDLVSQLLLHLPGQNDIFGLGILHLLFDGFLVDIQNTAQSPGDVALVPDRLPGIGLPFFQGPGGRLLLLLFLAPDKPVDAQGVENDHLRRGGAGQDVVVLVVNRPPGGVDGDLPGLLVDGPGRHLVILVDLEVVELPEQQQKCAHAQHQHHQQRPPADDLVGPAGGLALPVKNRGVGGTVRHAAAS